MIELRVWHRISVFALTAAFAACSPQAPAPPPGAPAKGAPLSQLGAQAAHASSGKTMSAGASGWVAR